MNNKKIYANLCKAHEIYCDKLWKSKRDKEIYKCISKCIDEFEMRRYYQNQKHQIEAVKNAQKLIEKLKKDH